MFYIALYRATNKRAATITRYPAIGVGSDVPCKCHLVSTRPSRKVTLINQSNNMATIDLPEYPVLGKQSIDSTQVHPCTLDPRMGLGGDFDGDTISANGILTTEANEETNKYLDSKARYIHTNGSFFTGKTDLISLTLFNLTRDPEDI